MFGSSGTGNVEIAGIAEIAEIAEIVAIAEIAEMSARQWEPLPACTLVEPNRKLNRK